MALECGDSNPTVCLCCSERLGGLSPAPLDLVRTSGGSLDTPSRNCGNSATPLSRGFQIGEPKSAEQLTGTFPLPSPPLEVLLGGGAGGPLFSLKEDCTRRA